MHAKSLGRIVGHYAFDLMSRSCTRSGQRGQRAYSYLVATEGFCTNAAPTQACAESGW